jgi:CHAT domain-containing protein
VYGVTDTGKSQFRLPKIPGVDAELRSIEDSYIQAYQAGNVKCQAKFIYSKESSLERFRVELNSGYDMVHYAGHGYFDESSPGNSSLFFWDKLTIPRSIMQLKASQLLSITQAAKVRAFYLSCCEGANSASESHLVNRDFLGIMDSLIVASVPTIIGMRWPLPDESAIILASEFYQGLFNMQPFDVALKLAKRHLYSLDPSQPTWASPILVDQSQY